MRRAGMVFVAAILAIAGIVITNLNTQAVHRVFQPSVETAIGQAPPRAPETTGGTVRLLTEAEGTLQIRNHGGTFEYFFFNGLYDHVAVALEGTARIQITRRLREEATLVGMTIVEAPDLDAQIFYADGPAEEIRMTGTPLGGVSRGSSAWQLILPTITFDCGSSTELLTRLQEPIEQGCAGGPFGVRIALEGDEIVEGDGLSADGSSGYIAPSDNWGAFGGRVFLISSAQSAQSAARNLIYGGILFGLSTGLVIEAIVSPRRATATALPVPRLGAKIRPWGALVVAVGVFVWILMQG